MRGSTARCLLAAACLAAALAAGACGSEESSTPEEPGTRIDLVIGDIVPLTGLGAGHGVSAQKAAQLAVEEINDAIGAADVEHTVEIVHADQTRRGPRAAARTLVDDGANCILGPWSRRGIARTSRLPAFRHNALLVSPRAPARSPAVALPPLERGEALSSENRGPGDDPSASFARLYDSTDPPIGPARAGDARQFDAVMLCYLSAVASGSDEAIAFGVGPGPAGATRLSWLDLPDAIETLDRGAPVAYRGVTLRVGVAPAASED